VGHLCEGVRGRHVLLRSVKTHLGVADESHLDSAEGVRVPHDLKAVESLSLRTLFRFFVFRCSAPHKPDQN
jgi:hypothetical protein